LEARQCLSGSYLLISSFGNDSVKRYDGATGAFVDTFVPKHSGRLTAPEGLVFGPHDHDLYVVGGFEGGPGQRKGVFRFDGDTGDFIEEFTEPGHLEVPVNVLFGQDGDLYVADQGFAPGSPGRVVRYDGTTGEYIDDFVALGDGGLSNPLGMVFGPDGNDDGRLDLYVCSFLSDSILRYDGATGDFLDAFVVGAGPGPRLRPLALTFGPDGDLYVTSNNQVAVLRFEGPDGETPGAPLGTFVPPGSGGLIVPDGLLFGPDGNGDGQQDLYVTSLEWNGAFKAKLGTSTVKRYDGVTGAFIDTFVAPDSGGLRGNDFLTFTETDPTTLLYNGATEAAGMATASATIRMPSPASTTTTIVVSMAPTHGGLAPTRDPVAAPRPVLGPADPRWWNPVAGAADSAPSLASPTWCVTSWWLASEAGHAGGWSTGDWSSVGSDRGPRRFGTGVRAGPRVHTSLVP
jgi:hypothetical protein